jgi:hypothetical protein
MPPVQEDPRRRDQTRSVVVLSIAPAELYRKWKRRPRVSRIYNEEEKQVVFCNQTTFEVDVATMKKKKQHLV